MVAFISSKALGTVLLISLIGGIVLFALWGLIIYKNSYRGLTVLALSTLFFINYYTIQAFLFSFGDKEYLWMMIVLVIFSIVMSILLQKVNFRLLLTPLLIGTVIMLIAKYYIHNSLITYAKYFKYHFDYPYWISKKTQDSVWPEAFNILIKRQKNIAIKNGVAYIFNSSVKENALELPSKSFMKSGFKAWATLNNTLSAEDAINPFEGVYPDVNNKNIQALIYDGSFLAWWLSLAKEDNRQLDLMLYFYQGFDELVKDEDMENSKIREISTTLIGKLDTFKTELRNNNLTHQQLEAEIDSCKQKLLR